MVDSNPLHLVGREIMPSEKLNIVSSRIILILSLLALLTVLTGYLEPRHPAPADEGAGAHIFQIAVALVMMTGLVFLFTADWRNPLRGARRLVLPGITLVASFTALYFLEHVYFR
jgi:glucan phosphoethanolaminetransferase (alkaline phosphatase superfamily)